MRRFFKRPRHQIAGVVALVLLVMPFAAYAATTNPILDIVGQLLFTWLQALTWLVSKLIDVLVMFAQYNDFYKHPIVLTGWNLVIQIANMMFLVALLVIAAGTVLNIQNYRYSRLLGNVILMAILVNFSRLIAGFFIQASQVVMLTFVNSFKDALYGNFATMFGLDKVFQFAAQSSFGEGASNIVITMIVSMMFMVMAGATIAAFVAIIVVRIVTLWVLLITSPLAYALAILPQTKKYADEWWSEFTKNLVSGPVIAFYLWLALAIVANYSVDNPAAGWLPGVDTRSSSAINFANQYLSLGNIVSFIVAMTFLSLGLKQATSASGVAGEWAKKASGAAGGALGFVAGANFVRERVTQPIQGYWALRKKRTDSDVRDRTMGLDAGMAAAGARTFGQVGRVASGASAYAGALGRGALTSANNLRKGQPALGVGQIVEQAAQAGEAAVVLGSKGYQQQRQRVRDFNEAKDASRAKLEDLSKLNTEQLLGRASTMAGGAVLPYALALAQKRDARKLGKDQELQAIHARAGSLGPDADKYKEQLIELDPEMASKAFFGGVMGVNGVLTDAFTKALEKDLSLTKLLTPAQLETLKKDNGSFANYIHGISRNAKEFKTAIENINEDFRGAVTKNIDMSGQDVERRKMVGEVTGHWDKVFDDKDKTVAAALQPKMIDFIKQNKKKFKDSVSVSAVGNGSFLETLAEGGVVNEKDLAEIAERSDKHRKEISTGITGPNGLYQSSVRKHGVTYKPGTAGFNVQEMARRAGSKVSRSKESLYGHIDSDKDAEAMFNRMVKSAKATDLRSIHESEIFTNPMFLVAKEKMLQSLGKHLAPRELSELAAMGEKQYETAKEIVDSILTASNLAAYSGLDKKGIAGLSKDEQVLARRVQTLQTNEATSDLAS